jgi:hypothetical protein
MHNVLLCFNIIHYCFHPYHDVFAISEIDGSFDQIGWYSYEEEFGRIYQENSNLVIFQGVSSENDKIGLDALM